MSGRGRITLLVLLGFWLLAAPRAAPAEAPAAGPAVEPGPAPSEAVESFVPVPLAQPEAALEKWEISTGRSGYVHPFLSVGEYYSDNLFNTDEDEEDEFYTVVSPGLWLALPASRQQLLKVNTLNAAPGGLAVKRFTTASERRFQGYALYRADIEEHSRFSDEDRVNQRGEGLLLYNFRGGMSVELADIYELNRDPYATGISRERQVDEFSSNLLSLLLTWRVGPRLLLRGDYARYTLDFDSDRNRFRERDDDAYSFYLFYQLLPKTSAFVLYEFVDIDYDESLLADSEEHHYFGGLQWDITAKSRGRAMLGYGRKDFEGEADDDREDLIGEARLDHRFSPRTSAYLRLVRQTNETDIAGTRDVLAHQVQLGYRQRLSAKISAAADLYYLRDSYRGEAVVAGESGERKDDYYSAGVVLGWSPRRWLNLGLGYRYLQRSSSFDGFDYRNNTAFLTVTAAL